MMNKAYNKIILVLIMMIVIVLNTNLSCFGSDEDKNLITNDLELNSYGSSNNKIKYGCYIEESVLLSIEAEEFNLPPNLFNYIEDIRLRVTYSQEDYKVYDCKVINYITGEIIEDISEENINKLFNIEYGKNIIKKEWKDTIKLSELKENEIYKYTASYTTQLPEIKNDIGKNCIIYIKEKEQKNYLQGIEMCKEISDNSAKASSDGITYNSGETFSIMYREAKNEELLRKIQKDEIIYLSKYNDGDKIEHSFEEYIYNDTEKNITIHIGTLYGTENTEVTIGKGEICGFDWMIYSAAINYVNENNQTGQKDKEVPKFNTNAETKETSENNDTTLAIKKLPQTGISMAIIFITIFSIIISIICCYKYSSYRDIK